jgi:transposase
MGSIVFVGMDVHKATIAVAVAEGGRGGEVRPFGIFPNRAEVIAKLAERLAGGGRELSFCYEAGPCGYGLPRQLEGLGHACVVVAPSLIPSKPGDRVKTDRRDALSLAKLHRAGELTPVWVPDPAHEAMRDLVRARATSVRVLGKARQHLQGFLLRHGRHYAGRTAWTLAYRRWLTTLRFPHPARNQLAAYCLANATTTHVLWIDGDIAWQPQDVVRLVAPFQRPTFGPALPVGFR